MDVRTFEAFSMKDAIKSVKKALGTDAVILSTKEKVGPQGKGTVFEVTAAAANHQKAGASSQAAKGHNAADLGAESAGEAIEALNARLTALADKTPTKAQLQALESGMQELKLLLVEALRTRDGSVLKDLPEAIVPIDRQLRIMGINDITIAELVKHLRHLPLPEDASEALAHYQAQSIRWMMKRIRVAPRWTIMPGTTTYQALVGTPGVGKTTLVAKLAALYAARDHHKVVVVSLDNQRLAAADQMRIFCKVIGVPFVQAKTPEEIPQVSGSHRDCELTLIDTAGISPKNAEAIAQLSQLKDLGLPLDFHLCLAATEKESQLDNAIRAFAPLGLQSLAFSKLDESWSFGEIYNLSKKWALPLSFFAIGPSVPEDVERATRERVVERIFGL